MKGNISSKFLIEAIQSLPKKLDYGDIGIRHVPIPSEVSVSINHSIPNPKYLDNWLTFRYNYQLSEWELAL